VLNKVPKSVQTNMKADLREIRDAPDRASAEAAIGVFLEKIRRQVSQGRRMPRQGPSAAPSLLDFPAEHWDHLRPANPIESIFATVRHRTVRTKGALLYDLRLISSG
jgi:putative transposase